MATGPAVPVAILRDGRPRGGLLRMRAFNFLTVGVTAPDRAALYLGHLDEHSRLGHAPQRPQLPQQRVGPIGSEVSARQRPELLFHFGVSHRIFRVPAMIFDPDGLALS